MATREQVGKLPVAPAGVLRHNFGQSRAPSLAMQRVPARLDEKLGSGILHHVEN